MYLRELTVKQTIREDCRDLQPTGIQEGYGVKSLTYCNPFGRVQNLNDEGYFIFVVWNESLPGELPMPKPPRGFDPEEWRTHWEQGQQDERLPDDRRRQRLLLPGRESENIIIDGDMRGGTLSYEIWTSSSPAVQRPGSTRRFGNRIIAGFPASGEEWDLSQVDQVRDMAIQRVEQLAQDETASRGHEMAQKWLSSYARRLAQRQTSKGTQSVIFNVQATQSGIVSVGEYAALDIFWGSEQPKAIPPHIRLIVSDIKVGPMQKTADYNARNPSVEARPIFGLRPRMFFTKKDSNDFELKKQLISEIPEIEIMLGQIAEGARFTLHHDRNPPPSDIFGDLQQNNFTVYHLEYHSKLQRSRYQRRASPEDTKEPSITVTIPTEMYESTSHEHNKCSSLTARIYRLQEAIRLGKRRLFLEKSKSQSQQRAAAIALAAKKGKIPKSKLKGASKKMFDMKKTDLEDYARTRRKKLPKTKKK